MEETYHTMTYGNIPLKLDTGNGMVFPKGIEILARVNQETGEVTFFIDRKKLEQLK